MWRTGSSDWVERRVKRNAGVLAQPPPVQLPAPNSQHNHHHHHHHSARAHSGERDEHKGAFVPRHFCDQHSNDDGCASDDWTAHSALRDASRNDGSSSSRNDDMATYTEQAGQVPTHGVCDDNSSSKNNNAAAHERTHWVTLVGVDADAVLDVRASLDVAFGATTAHYTPALHMPVLGRRASAALRRTQHARTGGKAARHTEAARNASSPPPSTQEVHVRFASAVAAAQAVRAGMWHARITSSDDHGAREHSVEYALRWCDDDNFLAQQTALRAQQRAHVALTTASAATTNEDSSQSCNMRTHDARRRRHVHDDTRNTRDADEHDTYWPQHTTRDAMHIQRLLATYTTPANVWGTMLTILVVAVWTLLRSVQRIFTHTTHNTTHAANERTATQHNVSQQNDSDKGNIRHNTTGDDIKNTTYDSPVTTLQQQQYSDRRTVAYMLAHFFYNCVPYAPSRHDVDDALHRLHATLQPQTHSPTRLTQQCTHKLTYKATNVHTQAHNKQTTSEGVLVWPPMPAYQRHVIVSTVAALVAIMYGVTKLYYNDKSNTT